MKTKPNDRYKLIVRRDVGKDEMVDFILKNPLHPPYDEALSIYGDPSRKMYMEAALLTGEEFREISEMLEISEETIECYCYIFFDVRKMNQLDKLSFLDSVDDEQEKTMMIWAMSEGLNFLGWRLGKRVDISPTDGLNELFTMAIYKSKEALFNPNKSVASIESTKWVKLSIEIAKLLKLWVLDSAAARQDLELAIKSVVPDFKGLKDL